MSHWAPGLRTFIERYNIKRYKGKKKEHRGKLILYKAIAENCSPTYITKPGAYKTGNTVINSRGADERRGYDCSFGLHVATLAFAKNYGHSIEGTKIIRVLVAPKDIKCVPFMAIEKCTCCSLAYHRKHNAKIRCTKLYVDGVVRSR